MTQPSNKRIRAPRSRVLRGGKPGDADVVELHPADVHGGVMDRIEKAIGEKAQGVDDTAPRCWRCNEPKKLVPTTIELSPTQGNAGMLDYLIREYEWYDFGWATMDVVGRGTRNLCPECVRSIEAESGKPRE